MHTVKGVAINRPPAPHSHAQKTADTITAIGDIPVLDPYSHGSTTLLEISSTTTKSAAVSTTALQPGDTAKDNRIGKDAAIHGPIYGMKRSNAAKTPHNTAL